MEAVGQDRTVARELRQEGRHKRLNMGVYVSGKESEKLWEIILDLDFLKKQAELYIKIVLFKRLHSISPVREKS